MIRKLNKVDEQLCKFTSFILGKPGTPQDLKVTSIDNKKATLSWLAPDSNGGSPITGYAIEKKDTSSKTGDWSSATSTTDTNITVSRLVEGHSYLFRVFTENDIGASEPAVTKKSVDAKLPYSKLGCALLLKIF